MQLMQQQNTRIYSIPPIYRRRRALKSYLSKGTSSVRQSLQNARIFSTASVSRLCLGPTAWLLSAISGRRRHRNQSIGIAERRRDPHVGLRGWLGLFPVAKLVNQIAVERRVPRRWLH